MFTSLNSFLEKFDLLSRCQYDFRKISSSVHTICAIYENLLKNVDAGLYTCSIFLDLTKAFDTVEHAILLEKMERYCGVRGLALKFFGSYLSGRKQYTNIDNHMPSLLKVKCRVPQGSSLAPLLFLININDLPQASHFNTTLFADDTYLALSDKNVIDWERRVNNELRNIDAWLKKKLSLNSSKSCYMLINKQPNISCECEL